MRILTIDIKAGFWENRYKYAVLCLCFLLLSMQFLGQYHAASNVVDNTFVPLSTQQSFSVADVLFFYFQGVRVDVLSNNPAAFPIGWFAVQAVIAVIVGHYPVRGEYYDAQIALHVGSRTKMAFSRVCWMLLAICAVYLVAVFVASLTVLLSGGFNVSSLTSVTSVLSRVDASTISTAQTALLACLPVMGSLAVSAAQIFVARIAGPVAGIMAVVAYDIAAIYVDTLAFLPGQTMLVRCPCFTHPAAAPWNVLVGCLLCLLVFAILFVVVFKKSDLLNLQKESE